MEKIITALLYNLPYLTSKVKYKTFNTKEKLSTEYVEREVPYIHMISNALIRPVSGLRLLYGVTEIKMKLISFDFHIFIIEIMNIKFIQ